VRERLGIDDDLELCARIYGVHADRRTAFAQFARLVHEAAQAGDAAAGAIFARAARELVDCVLAVRRALEAPPDAVVAVSHSGGVFDNVPAMVAAFRAGLGAAAQPFDYRTPRFPPAVGAALYAARIHGDPLDAAAIGRLSIHCKSPGVFQ
jgi:N-acetylglucosamine kinase-like BadF-type ATPase